ncbi:acyltransferase family protein [Nakamurella leprariae]|uniref:Acyltransferase n=1 Tax=Nakamurella leprariae TaxID=2803911 RepID=A0A939C185_9ACTN|nr:acyltransferase [Nakamurella leprariae]MBM9466869.1 acyltransferase [Nakamurella leprariae]
MAFLDRPRAAWADAAKGICILLVVLWHLIQKDLLQQDWQHVAEWPGTVWDTITQALVPLRMPLFFLISGLFAARAVSRSWPVLLRDRSAKFFWIFALWVVIQVPVFWAMPDFDTSHVENARQLVRQLVLQPPNVWYLYALAVYFVVARAARRLPIAVQLGGALALTVVAAVGLLPTSGSTTDVVQYLFWFLAGLHGRRIVEAVVARADTVRGVGTTALFAALATGSVLAPDGWWHALDPLVSAAAVLFGLTVSALIAPVGVLGRGLAGLGRHTLPIYVMHLPLIGVLHLATAGLHLPASPVAALLYPVVGVALVCAVCLVLERGLLALHARWLFELPAPIRALFDRWAGRGSGHVVGPDPKLPVQRDRRPDAPTGSRPLGDVRR